MAQARDSLPSSNAAATSGWSCFNSVFLTNNVNFEKYDVVRRTSEVAGKLAFGYTSNEVGFGWTNGVTVRMLWDMMASHWAPL